MGPMIAIARKHTANFSNNSGLQELTEELSVNSSAVNRQSLPVDIDLIDGSVDTDGDKKVVIDLDVIQEKYPKDPTL